MPQEPETGPFVTLVPSGERRSFPPGTPLTDALFDMGVVVKTPCGGKGTCGKCGMRIDGEPGEALACRTAVTRDITVHAGRANTVPVLDVPEFGLARRLAAAVDIGTTSVRVALADLDEKTSSEVSSFLNPQRRFGHDVISRIAAARDPAVNTTLTGLIRRAVRGTLD
ncbi:MAG: ATP-binding protein, partial [Deltaproteobacteria bacterium]|nr:ATP-binding protein [Deltaproteobacteria bacterium]